MIPIHDPALWPVRMVRKEVAMALRISERELRRRIAGGRFPAADDGRSWNRDVVLQYLRGGIKEFERRASRQIRLKRTA